MIGRQPVQNFKIETISNILDPRLTEFRKEIFREDLKLDESLMLENKPHEWWIKNLPEKIGEDAFKYSDRKWATCGFNNIEAIVEGDKIVGMSGCRIYGNFLRTSMHLYLLKSVRAKYPGIKYLEGGWFQRHLEFAKQSNLDGMFFTVYAYSKKLKALIRNHKNKTISLVDKQHLKYMEDIEEKGSYLFNGVEQTFFYYPINKTLEQFNPNEFP